MSSELLLALEAGKEIAWAVREYMKTQPNYKQELFENFFEFRQGLLLEISKEDRDFDDIMYWSELERLFVTTIIKEITYEK